jgi:hypothetical protein
VVTVRPTICNIQGLFFLHTQGNCVFYMILKMHGIMSLNTISQTIFLMDTNCVLCDAGVSYKLYYHLDVVKYPRIFYGLL